jgi:4-alpha-glucanotransferase
MQIEKKKEIPDAVVRLAWSSVAKIAIAQIQDFLKADETARMNTPSTLGTNWKYRVQNSELTEELAKEIKALNKLYNRFNEPKKESKNEVKREVTVEKLQPSEKIIRVKKVSKK